MEEGVAEREEGEEDVAEREDGEEEDMVADALSAPSDGERLSGAQKVLSL